MSGHPDLANVDWRKSSRSTQGADCVEAAAIDTTDDTNDS